MKIVVSSKMRYHIKKLGIFLIALALIAGMVGCDGTSKYSLTMAVAPGGSGTATDLTNASPYAAGTEVSITAVAAAGYWFVNWTAPAGTFANANAPQTTFTMPAQDVTITANFAPSEFHGGTGTAEDPYQVADWHQLDYVRNYLDSYFVLVNNLDSTTAGYEELASGTANQGAGWQPIGTEDQLFTGTFDGQGYEIRDLFINRPDEYGVGLFGTVYEEGVVENIGVVNAIVTGNGGVGGLVGLNYLGTVSDSYSTGSVSGYDVVGGLVGLNVGNTSYCYSAGSVTGTGSASEVTGVGGLVGMNYGNISFCYSTGSVTGVSPVGGLVGFDYFGTVSDSYSTGSVSGQDGVGGLVGVHGLGTVSDSYATGSVTGNLGVGGLMGGNSFGTVSNSYSTGSVTGDDFVGGLLGYNANNGTLSNSYYNYDEVLINGENIITIGALFAEDFEEWLANDKFLDINERLSEEDGYYVVNNVDDFKELLAFGQDGSLKFILKNDLDLVTEPNFYIPYLAGEFDGNGHKISNLSFNFDFVSDVGLFGYLAPGGEVTHVGVENVDITGGRNVGGLVGYIWDGTVTDSYSTGSVSGNDDVGGLVAYNYYGTVSSCYASGTVTGTSHVGGLVGWNDEGTVSNSYATGNVTGTSYVGGLVGRNDEGTVSNSYATGNVTGTSYVGGLVGYKYYGTVNNCYSSGTVTGNSSVGGLVGWNYYGTVSNSFWDTETSGQATSDGGTGKTTTEMQDITTFSLAGWNIIAVGGSGERNPVYIWNIVNNVTYPFLSWQPA